LLQLETLPKLLSNG